MKNLYKLLYNNKINYKDLKQVKNSYIGHLSYGDTKKLIMNSEVKKFLDADAVSINDNKFIYKKE